MASQADMAAIGLQGFKLCVPRMNKGVPFRVSWLLVASRWGVHGSNSAEGCLFVCPQADMAGIPFQGVPFLGPAGARWGPYGHLANEISGLRRSRWAVASHQGGTETSIWRRSAQKLGYPAAVRAEIGGTRRRSAKYGARAMKFTCFWRYKIFDFH